MISLRNHKKQDHLKSLYFSDNGNQISNNITSHIYFIQMYNTRCLQTKICRNKSNVYKVLFKQSLSSPQNQQFQRVYQLFKKQTRAATESYRSNSKNEIRKGNTEAAQKLAFQGKNKVQGGQYPKKNQPKPLSKDQNPLLQIRKQRALSSQKFDCISKKNNTKKSKRFTKNLIQYVKLNDKGLRDSKKSSENSNLSQIDKIKNENQMIFQFIKTEQKRIQQIQKQINQERKKHQSEKQLYRLSIQKLKKKVYIQQEQLREIDEIKQSFLSDIEDPTLEYDSLSIDSN